MDTQFSPLLASSVSAHDHNRHDHGICPVTGAAHNYCPPQPGDLRSPCPALNALANHGFLPRNGKDLTIWGIFCALREGYHLSAPLAFFLSFVGWMILGQFRKVSLFDFARHGLIEHNGSLFHLDARNEDEYAPTAVTYSLVNTILYQGGRYVPGRMTLDDLANIRVKREARLSEPLKTAHAEIARGEMAMAIGVLGGKDGAKNGLDLEVLHLWVTEERLPDGWKPDHTHGFWESLRMAGVVRNRMKTLRAGQIHNILDDEPTPTVFSPTDRMMPV